MGRFVRCGLLVAGMLAWTVKAHAMTTSNAAPPVSDWRWLSDIPSAFLVLAGVIGLCMLDWLYVRIKKQRAYRRLQRVVALERSFRQRSHYRLRE